MYYKNVLLIRYKNYIFSARSVRDRWVNIRSTFNHNLRKVDKSRETAQSVSEVYVPCWPLWKPLQFLRESTLKDVNYVSILLSYLLRAQQEICCSKSVSARLGTYLNCTKNTAKIVIFS